MNIILSISYLSVGALFFLVARDYFKRGIERGATWVAVSAGVISITMGAVHTYKILHP